MKHEKTFITSGPGRKYFVIWEENRQSQNLFPLDKRAEKNRDVFFSLFIKGEQFFKDFQFFPYIIRCIFLLWLNPQRIVLALFKMQVCTNVICIKNEVFRCTILLAPGEHQLLYFFFFCQGKNLVWVTLLSFFRSQEDSEFVTLSFEPVGGFLSVVVLLFYVHGKHLRSCRDGQLT